MAIDNGYHNFCTVDLDTLKVSTTFFGKAYVEVNSKKISFENIIKAISDSHIDADGINHLKSRVDHINEKLDHCLDKLAKKVMAFIRSFFSVIPHIFQRIGNKKVARFCIFGQKIEIKAANAAPQQPQNENNSENHSVHPADEPSSKKTPTNVWEERRDGNLTFVKNGKYTSPNKTVHKLTSCQEIYKNTIVYELSSCNSMKKLQRHEVYKTTITVDELKCLEAAKQEVNSGYNTAVVAFVSTREAGGSFTEGQQGSQEEGICYCSTLGSFMQHDLERFYTSQSTYFPLARNSEESNVSKHEPNKVLITPGIQVFRNNSYQLLNEPFEIGIISCPAKPYPNVKNKKYVNFEDRELMKSLIRIQLVAAYEQGYTSVVLGAFGCGAFKNPPEEVAKLYHEVLTGEFSGVFQSIRFPIYADNNQYNYNYTKFKKQFSKEVYTDND